MKIPVYPMDYEEFSDAIESNSYEMTRQFFHHGRPVGQQVNRTLMRAFRLYMAVGGMPQAVEAYREGKNFTEIDMVKRSIIGLYEADFKKRFRELQTISFRYRIVHNTIIYGST